MKNLLVITIIALLLSSLIGYLARTDKSLLNWEVGALIFTAVYIAWYSFETSKLREFTRVGNDLAEKLRQEMVMNNKISIQPSVVMEYEDPHSWRLVLKNIGKGAAINIKAESQNPNYNFNLDKRILAPNQAAEIDMFYTGDNGPLNIKKITNFQEHFTSSPVKAIIYFDRIKESKYPLITVVEINNPPNVSILKMDWGL